MYTLVVLLLDTIVFYSRVEGFMGILVDVCGLISTAQMLIKLLLSLNKGILWENSQILMLDNEKMDMHSQ